MGTALDLRKNPHFADALYLRSSGGQTTKHGSIFYQVYAPLRPGKHCADRSRRVTRALSFSQVTFTFKDSKIGPNVSLYFLSTHLVLPQ
jgi:hypothetical protein